MSFRKSREILIVLLLFSRLVLDLYSVEIFQKLQHILGIGQKLETVHNVMDINIKPFYKFFMEIACDIKRVTFHTVTQGYFPLCCWSRRRAWKLSACIQQGGFFIQIDNQKKVCIMHTRLQRGLLLVGMPSFWPR